MNTTDIADYFRLLRKENKLTQQNVADKLGISAQAVSKWERAECLPDIGLLPDLAKMYGVTVEKLLNGGADNSYNSFSDILETLNRFVDEPLFAKVLTAFEQAESVTDLQFSFDFFMVLNNAQKDLLLDKLMKLEDASLALDKIFHYISAGQRERLILNVAESRDYDNLEPLIPYMSKSTRTQITQLLLEDQNFEFLENMLPFLQREQKDMIIRHVLDNDLDMEILDDFIPFFDVKQRKMIAEPNKNIDSYKEEK